MKPPPGTARPWAAANALAALPAAAQAVPPMSYLHTAGASGDPVTRLGWGLGLVSVAVTLIVLGLLLWALLRRRRGAGDPHALAVHSDAGGMRWIYIGVGVSTLVLIACAVWTVTTLAALAMPPAAAATTLRVTASQWWWAVRYADADPARVFTTANEIHIPVGRPVRVELNSTDVIHSFWIPQLAGKMDVIPGQTNVMWLQADRPGVYRGQCAEFCGAEHARMAMWVVADAPQDFAAWREAQLQAAAEPASEVARRGEQAFLGHCASCHTVRGSGAGGILGPDLTHLMSRGTLAAGTLRNTPGELAAWIADAQSLKPGARMPRMQLSGPELSAIVAYLGGLH